MQISAQGTDSVCFESVWVDYALMANATTLDGQCEQFTQQCPYGYFLNQAQTLPCTGGQYQTTRTFTTMTHEYVGPSGDARVFDGTAEFVNLPTNIYAGFQLWSWIEVPPNFEVTIRFHLI